MVGSPHKCTKTKKLLHGWQIDNWQTLSNNKLVAELFGIARKSLEINLIIFIISHQTNLKTVILSTTCCSRGHKTKLIWADEQLGHDAAKPAWNSSAKSSRTLTQSAWIRQPFCNAYLAPFLLHVPIGERKKEKNCADRPIRHYAYVPGQVFITSGLDRVIHGEEEDWA